MVVQIVDARNPLLFRCEDLESYVTEVNNHKVNVLLINKADFLTQKQRYKKIFSFYVLTLFKTHPMAIPSFSIQNLPLERLGLLISRASMLKLYFGQLFLRQKD